MIYTYLKKKNSPLKIVKYRHKENNKIKNSKDSKSVTKLRYYKI